LRSILGKLRAAQKKPEDNKFSGLKEEKVNIDDLTIDTNVFIEVSNLVYLSLTSHVNLLILYSSVMLTPENLHFVEEFLWTPKKSQKMILENLNKRLKKTTENPGGLHIAWISMRKRELRVRQLSVAELNSKQKIRGSPYSTRQGTKTTYLT